MVVLGFLAPLAPGLGDIGGESRGRHRSDQAKHEKTTPARGRNDCAEHELPVPLNSGRSRVRDDPVEQH
jgi:hypothetical protein